MPFFFVVTIAFALGASSCATTAPLPPGPVHVVNGEGAAGPDYAKIRPRVSVRDELTVAMSAGDGEFDFRKSDLASEAQVFTALYEGLFSYNPVNIGPVRAAAEDWEVSEDKKTWTFTLRKNARFSNGDPVRAEDFRAAWLSILEMGDAAPYSSLFDVIEGARDYRLGKTRDRAKVGVSAPNDRTLVVKLASPAPYFRSMLCHHSWSPIHPSLLAAKVWDASTIISNGPYTLAEKTEEEAVLLRNENYWDAKNVDLAKVTLKFGDDDGNEATALWNSGEARWVAGAFNDEGLTDLSGIQVNAMFATHYYYICSTKPALRDARVRQALALALPWDEIRKNAFLPARTLIFPIEGYPEVETDIDTDTEKAASLLAQAGYAGGKGLPTVVLRVLQGAEKTGGIMAEAWQALGVPVKVEVVPGSRYFASLRGSDYDVGSFTWIGDFADPYTFLQMWRRDSNLNYAHYSDDEYEALLDQAANEEDEERLATLSRAEKLLLERGTVLPINYSPAVNLVDTDELDGWYPNVLDIHPFKYLSFRAFKPLPGVALGK